MRSAVAANLFLTLAQRQGGGDVQRAGECGDCAMGLELISTSVTARLSQVNPFPFFLLLSDHSPPFSLRAANNGALAEDLPQEGKCRI